MTRPSPLHAEPVSPAFLRPFAPLFFEQQQAGDSSVSALSLFGFSDIECEACLDAIDLCGINGACQAVEIYLHRYDEFVQPCDLVVDGLTLLRIPDRLDEDDLTWLTICMSTLAARSQVTVVPVLPPVPAHSSVLHCIAPYCPTFLSCDSEVVDYATVISAFLHLPRSQSPERFTCTECEHRTDLNSASTPPLSGLMGQRRREGSSKPTGRVATFITPSPLHSYCT